MKIDQFNNFTSKKINDVLESRFGSRIDLSTESLDNLQAFQHAVARELEEMGQSEIQSSIIGRKVMDELKELDKIAYIRFASVYTNFKEIGEFGEYIDELHGKSKKK